MKKVEGKNIPPVSSSPKFGQGDAARPEFQAMLNKIAQLAPAIENVTNRGEYLRKIRTLMAISDHDNSDYARWTGMLEDELTRERPSFEQLWVCLTTIEREANR